MSREERNERTEQRMRKPKVRFMFSIPKDLLTEDIKKAQTDAIHAYVFMKSSVQTKADKDIIEKSYDGFKSKMMAYTDAIIGAMKKEEVKEEAPKEKKKIVKKKD